MEAIMSLRDREQAELHKHPFFSWVNSSAVSLEERLLFVPIMAIFVMNFRDMNKWVLRFEENADEFKKIINGGTLEDETHSKLFLEDWGKLHLDDKLGWSASDTIWWLSLAEDTEPFRRYGIDFIRLAVEDGGDPLVRFAHSEAGEACGNVFFTHLSPLATKLGQQQGLNYRYFGEFHLNLENGHVLESEGVFEGHTLTKEQRELALALATRMFRIFEGMHDSFYAYCLNYVAKNVTPGRKWEPLPEMKQNGSSSRPEPDGPMHPSQQGLEEVLKQRKQKVADHPFYEWLRREETVSPLHKLRRFIPMWVMDIMGYRDLNRYVFHYRNPENIWKAEVNNWAADLETHSVLFLNDWEALQMDEALRWMASDTLQFFFLDPYMDVHRHNIIEFAKHGLRHRDPLLRLWLMEALEASGEAFFATIKTLALRVEADTGIRLDYLADRHDIAHPEQDSDRPIAPYFKGQPLTETQQQTVLSFIETVFNALEEQLAISLDVSRSNKFTIRQLTTDLVHV